MFYIDEDFNNLRKRKNAILEWSYKAVNWMLYWEKLRWLSDSRYRSQYGRSRRSAVWISKLSGETMKGQSEIVVQVIFHLDGEFSNSRKQKNTILENYKAVNCVLYWGTLRWSSERYCLRVGQFHKSTVRISKFFHYFRGNVLHRWRFHLLKEMKKYHYWLELLSRGLNVALRKNATGACRFQEGCFRKSAVRISKFCGGGGGGEVMKGQWSIIFHVIFHISEHFNNSRK